MLGNPPVEKFPSKYWKRGTAIESSNSVSIHAEGKPQREGIRKEFGRPRQEIGLNSL